MGTQRARRRETECVSSSCSSRYATGKRKKGMRGRTGNADSDRATAEGRDEKEEARYTRAELA